MVRRGSTSEIEMRRLIATFAAHPEDRDANVVIFEFLR
jgi:hypothetical protein